MAECRSVHGRTAAALSYLFITSLLFQYLMLQSLLHPTHVHGAPSRVGPALFGLLVFHFLHLISVAPHGSHCGGGGLVHLRGDEVDGVPDVVEDGLDLHDLLGARLLVQLRQAAH